MNCPLCRVELKVSERQGVEVDYCPRCRGVWLDRGELEKIIARSDAATYRDRDDDDDDDAHSRSRPERRDGDGGAHHPPRKREGFFSRFFDFD